MAVEAWTELLQVFLASSVAILAVLLLRRPLRRLGARAAYAAWLLVPVAVMAVILPAREATLAASADPSAIVGLLRAISAPSASDTQWQFPALLLWAVGAVAMALLFAWKQARFMRSVRASDDMPYDHVAGHGPAVVGVLKPRVVLPEDFHIRYTAREQELVLAHEQLHVARGDLAAQALATTFRCAFWFNPLVHFAAARFRVDQELACDADVLQRFPNSRRTYADAMLKTQLANFGLPMGCHWQSTHPLMERIAMLKQPLPSRQRRKSAVLLLTILVGAGAYAAWAAQPGVAQPGVVQPKGLSSIVAEDILTPPPYPKALLASGQSGTVLLHVLIAADGTVRDVKVKSSNPAGVFDQAALDAAKHWRLTMRTRASIGDAPEVWVAIPVEFRPN